MYEALGRMSTLLTRSRVVALVIVMLLMGQGAWAGKGGEADQGKNPTYPEVWGVELPTDDAGRARESLIFRDADDRILISYWFETTTERVQRIYDFFGQSTVKEWRLPRHGKEPERVAALSRMEAERKGYEEAKGVSVLATEREILPFTGPRGWLLKYDDGSLLKGSAGLSITYGRKTAFDPCNYRLCVLGRWWRGRASAEIPNPELNTGVMILRLYPGPQPLDPEELCECTGKMTEYHVHNSQSEITDSSALAGCKEGDAALWAISYRVRALQMTASAVLQDGTFLIKDRGYPTVIRFRPYLESPYLATRADLESPYLATRADLFHLPYREVSVLADRAVTQYRQENNKKDLEWRFDEYTAEDLIGIFHKLDPLVTEHLIKKSVNN